MELPSIQEEAELEDIQLPKIKMQESRVRFDVPNKKNVFINSLETIDKDNSIAESIETGITNDKGKVEIFVEDSEDNSKEIKIVLPKFRRNQSRNSENMGDVAHEVSYLLKRCHSVTSAINAEHNPSSRKSKSSCLQDDSFAADPTLQTFSRQFFALIKRRYDIVKRDTWFLLSYFIIPILLFVIGLSLVKFGTTEYNLRNKMIVHDTSNSLMTVDTYSSNSCVCIKLDSLGITQTSVLKIPQSFASNFNITAGLEVADSKTFSLSRELFFVIITVSLLCFVITQNSQFHEKELSSKSKLFHFIGGVKIAPYWFSNFIWDFCANSIISFMVVILILIFNDFIYLKGLPILVVAFLLFNLTIIPFSHCVSFLFRSHKSVFAVNIFVGIFLFIVVSILRNFTNVSVLSYFAKLFPTFAFVDIIYCVSNKHDWFCSKESFMFLIIELFIYGCLSFLLECIAARLLFASKHSLIQISKDFFISEENDSSLLNSLRNSLQNSNFDTTDSCCIGFLNANVNDGSLQQENIGFNHVMPEDVCLLSSIDRAKIGYCPDFNVKTEFLTALEYLSFYAIIKGVPDDKVDSLVSFLCSALDLDQDANFENRYLHTYNRKIAVATAFIGNPKIVFLDAPTCGMDVVSRRFTWDFIYSTLKNRVVVLTTDSINECETICNQIGITLNGEITFFGSSQFLKSKFGNGYQINLTIESEYHLENVRKFFSENFEHREIECLGVHLKLLVVPSVTSPGDLPVLLRLLEKEKKQLSIREYSVGQISLDQIYLHFAKNVEDTRLSFRQNKNYGTISSPLAALSLSDFRKKEASLAALSLSEFEKSENSLANLSVSKFQRKEIYRKKETSSDYPDKVVSPKFNQITPRALELTPTAVNSDSILIKHGVDLKPNPIFQFNARVVPVLPEQTFKFKPELVREHLNHESFDAV